VQGIKAQTKKLLDEIEKILQMAGSSMQKVLKCNVYLADIRDYAEMNEVYRGRFGADPPARTTLAIANIPLKDCLVEIECTAYI
jgi:enamine deaminase RidA (YjgF/YER057c/UK114 family)